MIVFSCAYYLTKTISKELINSPNNTSIQIFIHINMELIYWNEKVVCYPTTPINFNFSSSKDLSPTRSRLCGRDSNYLLQLNPSLTINPSLHSISLFISTKINEKTFSNRNKIHHLFWVDVFSFILKLHLVCWGAPCKTLRRWCYSLEQWVK